MNFSITIDKESFKKQIEEKMVQTNIFDDTIREILDREEIQEVLVNKTKELISSGAVDELIEKSIKDYIENYDIEYDENISQVLSDSICEIIKSKFNLCDEK